MQTSAVTLEPTYGIQIPDKMFFRIGEVADLLGVKTYVLRYWETEFSLLAPNKSNSQQRKYTRTDVENAVLIKHLLYDLRFSIEGAKKRISEMRRQGQLAEARKQKTNYIADAIKELQELIAVCK